jgi:hypothetical protein
MVRPVTQEVPVLVLSSDEIASVKPPTLPTPEVNLYLPSLKVLRNIVERMKVCCTLLRSLARTHTHTHTCIHTTHTHTHVHTHDTHAHTHTHTHTHNTTTYLVSSKALSDVMTISASCAGDVVFKVETTVATVKSYFRNLETAVWKDGSAPPPSQGAALGPTEFLDSVVRCGVACSQSVVVLRVWWWWRWWWW